VTALSSDTPAEIERIQLEIIRRLPPWKKLALVDDLNETVKAFGLSGIRQRNPGATDEQIRRLLAGQMLGEELAHQVYDRAR
jgi:hypothetical protein